jgi:hypothetical protein
MPEKEVVDRAEEDLREGKSPSTAAGEFVHEEIRTRTRRKARRTFATTGNRHRAEQGSPGRHSACASQARENKRSHSKERGERLPQRTIWDCQEGIG